MISKMVSSKSVIAKIIADLNLDESQIKISDFNQWIGEAMLKIGAVNLLNHKVVILKLKDYQAALPCDLEKIDYVAYADNAKSRWITMKKATGVFSVFNKSNTIVDNQEDILSENCSNLLSEDKDNIMIESENNLLLGMHTMRVKNQKTNIKAEYALKPGYIISNMRDGYLKISYFGTYTDEEGMPLIPDELSYFEALYWYVAMKLLYIEYFNGRKPLQLYYDAKSSWNFYRNQAYAEATMPDLNDLINIKNTWHTLVPDMDSMDNFLSTTGDSQIIYNLNSIWR